MIRSSKRVPATPDDTHPPSKLVHPPITLTWHQAAFIATRIQGVINLQPDMNAIGAATACNRIEDLREALEVLDEPLNESHAVYMFLVEANKHDYV